MHGHVEFLLFLLVHLRQLAHVAQAVVEFFPGRIVYFHDLSLLFLQFLDKLIIQYLALRHKIEELVRAGGFHLFLAGY